MLIHSVTPHLLLEESPELPAYATKKTSFGHITGYDTPGGFCIARIHSTNPADYLNQSHIPGGIYNG